MSKDWLKRDPKAAAEAEKYGNPVPSREFMLEFLQEWGRPISHPRLCQELGIVEEDSFNAVGFRLKAMCRDGQLMSNRKNEFGLIKNMELIPGRVIGHRDGFGFVTPDGSGDDLFISPRQMKQVFDGDRVLVQESGRDHKGRREGKIIEVLEHCTRRLVGRFSGQDGFGSLRPENQRITQEVMIKPDPENPLQYQDQQLVIAEITKQPGKRNMPLAKVVEVLGDHLAPGMEIKVAIANYDVPSEWPDAVRQETGELQAEVEESAKANRVDLRHLPLVTIDGEDARDFDDAVYAEKKRSGGWRLWVAIADVSWYVRPDSALDHEGHNRGNSVYFPEYVVPMLPELLSNGLCSLNPHVDRLAMVCEMTISAAGKLSGYQFYEAVIQSHARLTYTKVGQMLMQPDSKEGRQLRQEYAGVMKPLETLYSLYHALRGAREERGAIDFETTETRIVFSDQRKIEEIVPVQRNDAHKLIEECMLCANVATARFLAKLKVPTLYRVHEGPKEAKLANLRAYLSELGLNLAGGEEPEPKDYQRLAEQIEGRPDRHIIQTMMLRSMRQAVYSPDNQGHFGLAYPAYTHFTSPIRRYPDLMVHRAIRAQIHSAKQDRAIGRPDGFQPNPDFLTSYSMEQLLQLGEHCSMTERRADDATRDVVSWLKCEYMQSQVGNEYDGAVSAVTGFGLFIELEQLFVEGLVHITALPGDYYHFDAAKQRLLGERTRKKFQLGDRVRVKVVRVDLDERKIDFEMVEALRGKRRKKRDMLAEGSIGNRDPKPAAAPVTAPEAKKLPAHHAGHKDDWGHKAKPEKGHKAPRKRGAKNSETELINPRKRGVKTAAAKTASADGLAAGKDKPKLSAAERELMELSGKVGGKSRKSQKRKAKSAKPKAGGKKAAAAKGAKKSAKKAKSKKHG
ncbi:ribonuclease R [Marinobacterium jannaschii]|uniref:ribonuclease R n=1 Tax=Marinobacterium jannaschii TaxID=64970 RepID=UPI000480C281|nr:ribonuclease R [Marinobacterium jannaschii]